MKKRVLLPLLAFVFILAACGDSTTTKEKDDPGTEKGEKEKSSDDETDIQADPAEVVKAIFKAAKSGKYAALSDLCAADSDGDTKNICDVENQSAKKQEEFQSYFGSGKIVGEPDINGDEAKVKIKFGPDGDKSEEMNLVRKNKKWYLASF